MKLRYKTSDFFNPTHTVIGIDLINWLQLLWRNRFAINFRFWPKALLLTGISMLNAPFQFYEFIAYSKRIKKVKVKSPVFILGHPRSGTTYLHYVLSQDPQFSFCQTYEGLAPHVFLSSGKIVKAVMNLFIPATRPQDNVKAGAALPIEEEFAMGSISQTSWVHGLYFPKSIFDVFDECVTFKRDKEARAEWKKHFLFFAKKLAYQNHGKTLLLKSPCNTARIKEILEVFPDARFIHIHRNPYEVYLSNVGLYEKILPLLGLHRVKGEYMEKYVLYMYEEMYSKYLRDREVLSSDQLYELPYKSFIADPMKELEKAYYQLSMGTFDSVEDFLMKEVAQSESYQKNKYSNINKEVRQQIANRWKFAFDVFGYELEQEK
ncbi:MAG TPA: sulfotransferase [Chryseolinea sp.]|nr:sulfotransferase [Chryseolinea sp.]